MCLTLWCFHPRHNARKGSEFSDDLLSCVFIHCGVLIKVTMFAMVGSLVRISCHMFNRPGVAGAVLHTASSLIN